MLGFLSEGASLLTKVRLFVMTSMLMIELLILGVFQMQVRGLEGSRLAA
jgi:hypothetical protein